MDWADEKARACALSFLCLPGTSKPDNKMFCNIDVVAQALRDARNQGLESAATLFEITTEDRRPIRLENPAEAIRALKRSV